MNDVVQCFKCSRWVERGAVQPVPTVDAEAALAPPIIRLWCGTCLSIVKEDTEAALSDLVGTFSEEEVSETGWQEASFDEIKDLLENGEL